VYLLQNRYFIEVNSRERSEINKNLLLIVTNTADELSDSTKIDDFERP